MLGILSMTHFPWAKTVAGIMATAAFLAPPICTEPWRGFPPVTTNLFNGLCPFSIPFYSDIRRWFSVLYYTTFSRKTPQKKSKNHRDCAQRSRLFPGRKTQRIHYSISFRKIKPLPADFLPKISPVTKIPLLNGLFLFFSPRLCYTIYVESHHAKEAFF